MSTAAYWVIGSGVEDFFDLEFDYFLLVLFFHNLVRVPPLWTELLSEIIPNEVYQHLFVLARFWYNLSEKKLSFPIILHSAWIIQLFPICISKFHRLPGQLRQGICLTADQRLFIKQFFSLKLRNYLWFACKCFIRLYLSQSFVFFWQSHQRIPIVFVFMLLTAFFLQFHVFQDLRFPTFWLMGWHLWILLLCVPIGLI